MERGHIVTREVEGEVFKYYFDIEYNQGSFLLYPYVRGYYLIACPCETIKYDDNDTDKIVKNDKYEARELLFEISEPNERAFVIAKEVADCYIDSLIVQIEQNKLDALREEQKTRKEIREKIKKAEKDGDKDEEVKSDEDVNKYNIRRSGSMNKSDDSVPNTLEECKYYARPSTVRFEDVAGLTEVKRELQEMANIIRNREKYDEMGVESSLNNILLSGSSGCGKTMLAKCLANELGYNVFSISGDASAKYTGTSKMNITRLFAEARKFAPSLIFIDECEIICSKRENNEENTERQAGTSALLAELDGFNTTDDVICVLATNIPEKLDGAVLTRMTKKIHISNPDFETRKGILELKAKKMKVAKDVDMVKLARNLSGLSGREISSILNNAGMIAVRKGLKEITMKECEEALDVVVAGLKSESKKLNDNERIIVANHEMGHALLTYLLKNERIQKISILPRTSNTLGYVSYMNENENDVFLKFKEDMLNDVVVSLGGRAIEEIKFNKVTGGCSNDLEKATNTVEFMVTKLGMCDSFGLASMNPNDVFMREKILKETNSILNKCYEKAKEVLNKNLELLDKLVETLLEKEEMGLNEFEEVISQFEIVK